MALSRRIIVVPMDGEDRDPHVDVQILIVHMVKGALEILTGITEHFQLTRFITQAVHPDRTHHLVHGLPGRFVLVEQIPSQQHHVDILLLGQTHHLVETLPAVVSPDGISFIVPNMVVG